MKRAYLIGEAMEGFAAEIGDAIPVDRSGDLATAVATRQRRPGRAILSCCHLPARRSTSSEIMSSAAMRSAILSGRWSMDDDMSGGRTIWTRPNCRSSPRPRAPRSGAARFSRADRTPLGLWFWEIDRVLLLLVSMLIAVVAGGGGRGGVPGRGTEIVDDHRESLDPLIISIASSCG